MQDLKPLLDELAERYNTASFIDDDPVQFPRRYSRLQDIEIVSFLTATIAWGRRAMILNSAEKMLNIMGSSPYDYVMSEGWATLGLRRSLHRTFFTDDLEYFCRGLKSIYSQHHSIEKLFTDNDSNWQGIATFREAMASANASTYSKHISNPGTERNGAACKRLHLALRWLVRDDGIVDLGVWKHIPCSQLIIPLDVHVGRIARLLGMTQRKSNDRVAAEQITATLRQLDPHDPVRYDFALFGYGIETQNKESDR